MPVVYLEAPAGLTLSLVRSTTPEGATTTAAFTATARAGIYKATLADAAAGDVATVLLNGSTLFGAGTLQSFGGFLWLVQRSRSNQAPIYPIASTVNNAPLSPTCLVAYRKAAMTHPIACVNADGSLPDLSGKELDFIVSTVKDVVVIRKTGLTVQGDDNNVAVVELDGADHDLAPGTYRHAVWEGDYPDGRPWAQGDYIIEPIAGPYVAE